MAKNDPEFEETVKRLLKTPPQPKRDESDKDERAKKEKKQDK